MATGQCSARTLPQNSVLLADAAMMLHWSYRQTDGWTDRLTDILNAQLHRVRVVFWRLHQWRTRGGFGREGPSEGVRGKAPEAWTFLTFYNEIQCQRRQLLHSVEYMIGPRPHLNRCLTFMFFHWTTKCTSTIQAVLRFVLGEVGALRGWLENLAIHGGS